MLRKTKSNFFEFESKQSFNRECLKDKLIDRLKDTVNDDKLEEVVCSKLQTILVRIMKCELERCISVMMFGLQEHHEFRMYRTREEKKKITDLLEAIGTKEVPKVRATKRKIGICCRGGKGQILETTFNI